MSKNPFIDSHPQSSPSSTLKPELAIALGSLEVQLDQELTRYRRTRNGIRQAQKVSIKSPVPDQIPELDSTTEALVTTEPSSLEVNINKVPTISPPSPDLKTQKHEEINHIQGASAEDTLINPNMSSSIVPTKAQAGENQTLVTTNTTPTHPDDYLESSEALLRSLQTKEPQTKKNNNHNDSLLSPVGIGSMLLLLLASLTLGYVVLNPQTFPQLNLSKLTSFKFNFSQKPEDVETNTSSPAQPNVTPIAKYPNLAAREFPEVNDPNDVVGLKPKAKPTPTPTAIRPKPVSIATPTTPVQPTALPSITPKITQPKTNTVIQPSADGYYHLIADNKGNNALTEAQKVVSDAYLSDGKKYIYLGALKTQAEANKRLQELKTKGIQARVRQP